MNRCTILVLVPMLYLLSQPAYSQAIPCDSSYVSLDGFQLAVKSSGGDDTDNLQCALDAAVDNGISKIQLLDRSYSIGALEIARFEGVLSGVSKARTNLDIEDDSVDCVAMEENGKTPAAIKFIEGSPRVQNMAITGGSFCMEHPEEPPYPYLLHFSGTATGTEECSNDVIFGVLDRVTLTSFSDQTSGVIAASEGLRLGGCKEVLSGTLKVNRSEFRGFWVAVFTSMRAGSQVDINFNEFSENLYHLYFPNTNQSTYVVNNKFYSVSRTEKSEHGIYISRYSESAPTNSKFFISNNTFENEGLDRVSFSIVLNHTDFGSTIKPVITSNNFRLKGDSVGIVEHGFNGGTISGNRFSGDALYGIAIAALSSERNSSNWTITDNTGFGNLQSAYADIALGIQSSSVIIGPGHGDDLSYFGTSNTDLSTGSGSGSGSSSGSGSDSDSDSGPSSGSGSDSDSDSGSSSGSGSSGGSDTPDEPACAFVGGTWTGDMDGLEQAVGGGYSVSDYYYIQRTFRIEQSGCNLTLTPLIDGYLPISGSISGSAIEASGQGISKVAFEREFKDYLYANGIIGTVNATSIVSYAIGTFHDGPGNLDGPRIYAQYGLRVTGSVATSQGTFSFEYRDDGDGNLYP